MGMFDYVNFKCKCPFCKVSTLDDFQTKDSECLLAVVETSGISNWYTSCPNCDKWVEFNDGTLNENHSFNKPAYADN